MSTPSATSVALITYSTKPRGGVNHTLALGEALHARNHPVLVVGLGDPERGFFRPVAAPTLIVPAPAAPPGGGLEAKVDANIDALEAGLADVADRFAILHAQDCIAARAAARVRDAGTGTTVVRTVHHVDDFDTAKLMDCQRRAIHEPDHVLVVSRMWQQISSQLFDDKLIERQVGIEGFDHPIAPSPHVAIAVNLVAVGIGIPRRLEPPERHPLPVTRAAQQPINYLLVGLR